MISYLPRYRDALLLTLRIGWQGVLSAILLGLVCAAVMHFKVPVLRQIIAIYIELFRNTPLLVQLFFLYFALPKIGISLKPATCGVLGLGLLGGAYMAETFRSGLENIPLIQSESAQSLGMNRREVFSYVILPQAVSKSVPGLVANVIFLLKETSVFSTVSLMDLMFTAKDLIGMYAKTIECLTLLVAFYLIMLLPVSLLGSFVERRMRYAEFGN
jgi:polar amino acid transport system permease protein